MCIVIAENGKNLEFRIEGFIFIGAPVYFAAIFAFSFI